jgi:serine/threonine-protein kinase
MAVDAGQHRDEEKDFPETLGRYRLIRRISTGGMALVYEARRESLAGVAPRVAIKVILPEHARDMNFQKLFVNEARIGSQLQHPNLVQIQDFDREKDRYYLVMEYVEGPTLRRVLSLCKRNGLNIPLTVIAEVGRQMLEGLHYAHTAIDEEGNPRHLVHRDIKPGNIILNPQGVVKVLDFGISKALTGKETGDGVKGTWGYMSPEQARAAPVSGAADQWGVAAVLFELACLHRIFADRDQGVIRERMEKDDGARQATTLSGQYRDLGPILVRALQRDPMARYPSALDFSRALAELVPEPIVTRETLIEFQKKISNLEATRLQGGDVSRSHSTLSRVPSSKPYQSGIPVSVGNVHRPMSAAEIRPEERPKRKAFKGKSPGTVYLAIVGAAFCVLLFTVLQIFSGDKEEVVDPEDILLPIEDVSPPTLAPVEPPLPEAVRLPPRPEPAIVVPAASPIRRTPVVETTAPDPIRTQVEREPVADVGLINISSWPKSRVYVDGVYLQDSPLSRHSLPTGSHEVRLITEGGRQHQFSIEVSKTRLVSRIWHFDSNTWLE